MAAWRQVREQVVFTTHTPLPAGNETYPRHEVLRILGRLADMVGDREYFLSLGRMDMRVPEQAVGMSALALRAGRYANAVSHRHGEVARARCQVPGGRWQVAAIIFKPRRERCTYFTRHERCAHTNLVARPHACSVGQTSGSWVAASCSPHCNLGADCRNSCM